jgi:hypothetical protein
MINSLVILNEGRSLANGRSRRICGCRFFPRTKPSRQGTIPLEFALYQGTTLSRAAQRNKLPGL